MATGQLHIVRLLMTPMPSVRSPHAPSRQRPFIRNFGYDQEWRSLLFVMNVRRSEVIIMPSVRNNTTSDALNFWLEFLKEGATLGLTKCTTFHSNVEHIDQEPRKSACLRLRSGVRFHMASENGCLTLDPPSLKIRGTPNESAYSLEPYGIIIIMCSCCDQLQYSTSIGLVASREHSSQTSPAFILNGL